jgi:hypothetical protein
MNDRGSILAALVLLAWITPAGPPLLGQSINNQLVAEEQNQAVVPATEGAQDPSAALGIPGESAALANPGSQDQSAVPAAEVEQDQSADTGVPQTISPPAATSDQAAQNPSLLAPVTDTVQPGGPPSGQSGPMNLTSDYYTPKVVANGTSKLPIRFGIAAGILVDDNINISKEDRQSDVIEILTPSFILETGRADQNRPTYASLTFDPDIQFFDLHQSDNTIDYHVLAQGEKTWNGKLVTGLSQAYDTYSGPNIDVGGRLDSEAYTTRLYGSYPLTHKINCNWEALQVLTDYDRGYDNVEWKGDTYVDYQVFPKTRIGVGIEGGYVDFINGFTAGSSGIEQGPNLNQIYAGVTVGFAYTYSKKLTATGKVGYEKRQYEGAGSSLNPIADFDLLWTPFTDTIARLDVSRHTIQAIHDQNTDYNYTSVGVTLNQKIFRDFSLGMIISYSNSEYFSFDPTVSSTGLTLDYYTLRPSLQWRPDQNYAFSCYYQFEKSVSTEENGGFRDNQIGITASLSY